MIKYLSSDSNIQIVYDLKERGILILNEPKIKIIINLKLLKVLRNLHSHSISDLAFYLGYKTPASYWLIETGQRNISVPILYKIAKLYDMSMESFLIEKEVEEESWEEVMS